MPEHKRQPAEHHPHGRRDQDSANDRPHKRRDYTAGANGDEGVNINAAEAEAADSLKPDKDGTGW